MKYYQGSKLVYKLIRDVFPLVDRELSRWTEKAGMAEDAELALQALASIRFKKFHVQGGSVYSLYPGADLEETVRFITAFQTISDYLDNLCDRAGVQDEEAFRQLHLAMHHAVDDHSVPVDYYRYFPHFKDGGYLHELVNQCRDCISRLPSYRYVAPYIKKYVRLYSHLQAFKHLEEGIREKKMEEWARGYMSQYPGISVWEFSAAAGSTLGIFTMYAAAQCSYMDEGHAFILDRAYFPWITGLHILLDYLIDIHEDIRHNDLNLTWYESDMDRCRKRLSFFVRQAFKMCKTLPYPGFHATIVRGLLAMYLSDPKASSEPLGEIRKSLLKQGGLSAYFYYHLCRLLRCSGKLSNS